MQQSLSLMHHCHGNRRRPACVATLSQAPQTYQFRSLYRPCFSLCRRASRRAQLSHRIVWPGSISVISNEEVESRSIGPQGRPVCRGLFRPFAPTTHKLHSAPPPHCRCHAPTADASTNQSRGRVAPGDSSNTPASPPSTQHHPHHSTHSTHSTHGHPTANGPLPSTLFGARQQGPLPRPVSRQSGSLPRTASRLCFGPGLDCHINPAGALVPRSKISSTVTAHQAALQTANGTETGLVLCPFFVFFFSFDPAPSITPPPPFRLPLVRIFKRRPSPSFLIRSALHTIGHRTAVDNLRRRRRVWP